MPSACLINQKDGRDGETDGKKRWPCLLPIRPIMSDEEGEAGGSFRAERKGNTEVRAMEGWKEGFEGGLHKSAWSRSISYS